MTTMITDVYERLLTSLGCKIEDSKVCILVGDDHPKPITISGRELVIPTQDVLRASKWKEQIGFHPLSESIALGESVVLKRLRRLIIKHVNEVLGVLLLEILSIAIDKDRHSTLSPTLTGLLGQIPDVDQLLYDQVKKMVESIDFDSTKLIGVYLKRKAVLNDKEFRRGAIVTFPIMQELLDKDSKKILGVDFRKKDRVMLQALLEWIFPNCDGTVYSKGSNSDIAPYFDALIRAYLEIQRHLNAAIWKFQKQMPMAEFMMSDIAWEDDLVDLRAFVGQVPPLAGNEGEQPDDGPQGAKLIETKGTSTRTRDPVRVREPEQETVSETPATQPAAPSNVKIVSVNPTNGRRGGRDENREPVDEVEAFQRSVMDLNRRPTRPRYARRDGHDESRGRGRDDRDYDRRDRDDRGRGRSTRDYRDDDRDQPRYARGNRDRDRDRDSRHRGRGDRDSYYDDRGRGRDDGYF